MERDITCELIKPKMNDNTNDIIMVLFEKSILHIIKKGRAKNEDIWNPTAKIKDKMDKMYLFSKNNIYEINKETIATLCRNIFIVSGKRCRKETIYMSTDSIGFLEYHKTDIE